MRSKGYEDTAIKLVLWGQPGTYKTTFASRLEDPLFVDPNGGSSRVNVERERVSSWNDIQTVLDATENCDETCSTIVLDEFADIERLALEDFLRRKRKKSLAHFGHGQGFVSFRGLMAGVFRQLARISVNGVNVVCIAHATEKTFSNPDGPDYDKYVPIMDRGVWNSAWRWSDATMYFGQKVKALELDTGKTIGRTGESRIYTSQTALFDAKNRFNMRSYIENGYNSTKEFLLYVEGTRLLNTEQLEDKIKDNKNFTDSLTDSDKVRLFVDINMKEYRK